MKPKESTEIITERNKIPAGWMEVTKTDHRSSLQFAIDQLEAHEIPYIVKRFRGKGVSIWRKRK